MARFRQRAEGRRYARRMKHMNEQQAEAIEHLSAIIRPVREFRLSIDDEIDRGAVLMAAVFLHETLRNLLARRFVDDAANTNELLRSSGALGTFSSRIDLAFAIEGNSQVPP